ncbi:MAG TPA: hypothetical protein DIC52_25725 [Candidatus Latescibacteria bacterium]|mgnify:CR=1 FL=1|nr:hypothetical protein [Candidatus Latescibacterota bacterium]
MTCAILIVDRDPHWTEKVSNAFVPYLVRVHTASMAKSALSIVRNSSLDLVVLDAGIVSIEMYTMNLHRRTRPKLIVTSSVRDFGMAVDSLRVGASDIFLRPVSLRDLIRRATRELDGRIASPHYLARRLDGFLMAHLGHSDLDLTRLSSAFGISASYASLLLREGSWGGFRARLAHHRVAQAKSLLVGTDEPLYLIAEECGFSSPSRLSETFLRVVGIGPKRFRQQRAIA